MPTRAFCRLHHLAVAAILCAAAGIIRGAAAEPGPAMAQDRHFGSAWFRNPILAGDYPDPSVVRVGEDYYMVHSSFEYAPGLLIWHSRDLVHWNPVCHALDDYIGSVWAPDIAHIDGRFFIYFPAAGSNWVVTAETIHGPWSKPARLDIDNIDPGHVIGPNGQRYLYVSRGDMAPLSQDGLTVTGSQRHVYDGWPIPDDWLVECFCLEGPKLFRRDDTYYLLSAQGGTAGPATSHMIVVARSESPEGPWRNSPRNPLVHTNSPAERWWSQGHGTLVEAGDGSWWTVHHAYEKGYHTLGRQTLMLPVEWTLDGWPNVPEGVDPAGPIPTPAGDAVPHGMTLSDDFTGDDLGLSWRFFREHDPAAYSVGDGQLKLRARGSSPADGRIMACIPGDHSYEVEVDIDVPPGAEGGILLFYSPACFAGVGFREGEAFAWRRAARSSRIGWNGPSARLRLRNDRHQVSVFARRDGGDWKRIPKGMEVSGYHHNVFGGFMGLRIALYAAGTGEMIYRDFSYRALPRGKP
jgi:beta-xylosidase